VVLNKVQGKLYFYRTTSLINFRGKFALHEATYLIKDPCAMHVLTIEVCIFCSFVTERGLGFGRVFLNDIGNGN